MTDQAHATRTDRPVETTPDGRAQPTVTGAAIGPPGYPAVAIVDEGMREGLQIEDPGIPVEDKVRLLDAMGRTGLKRIVAGSFVSPKWTPQMAHIGEILDSFEPGEGVIYTALALNAKGVERRAERVPPLSLDKALPATLVHLSTCSFGATPTAPSRPRSTAGRRSSSRRSETVREKHRSASTRPGARTGSVTSATRTG